MSKAARKPGRPRDPALDGRILAAALNELARWGYEGMSLDRVARDAGATKPTLYRRFRSKEELAVAAVHSLQQSTLPAPTGDCFEDLVAILADLQHCLLRPNGMSLIGVVLVEEERTPKLIQLFRKRIVKTRRDAIGRVLAAGVKLGVLRRDADLDAATNLMVGAYYARYLAGDGFPRTFPRRVVQAVWPALKA
jgi:AcrR family transcriptional regulator